MCVGLSCLARFALRSRVRCIPRASATVGAARRGAAARARPVVKKLSRARAHRGKNTRTSRLRLLIAEADRLLYHIPAACSLRARFCCGQPRAVAHGAEGSSMMDRDVSPRDIFMHEYCYRPGHISKRIYAGSLLKERRAWEADGKTRVRGMRIPKVARNL